MATCGGVRVLVRSAANICRVSARTFSYSAALSNGLFTANYWQKLRVPHRSLLPVLNAITGPNQFQARLYSDDKPSLEEIKRRVLDVCKAFDKINAEKLTEDTNFVNDLGLDSLDHVELIMAMEDEFGFEIPDAEAEKLLRPADVIQYIAGREAVHI